MRKNSIELPLLQQNDRVFVNRESADVETLEDPEDYIESEEDDEENEDEEEDEDVSEDAENDESTLETLNRKSDPLPLRFKPGTPRRVIRQVIQRLPPGRTGGIVSRGWRGPKRRGRDKRRRRKLGHCKHRRCGGIRRRQFVPARTRRRLRRLPRCCFHRYPCRNYQARRMCRG